MDESVIWGGIGLLLAIGGLGIIAPEVLHELQLHGAGSPVVLYGLGVAAAVALTVLVILPSIAANR
jgi:hypothetical protein